VRLSLTQEKLVPRGDLPPSLGAGGISLKKCRRNCSIPLWRYRACGMSLKQNTKVLSIPLSSPEGTCGMSLNVPFGDTLRDSMREDIAQKIKAVTETLERLRGYL